MARKKGPDDEGDPNAWMATFSDLLSLLLTFFVLIFAMKAMDKGKLEETLGFFRQGGMGILRSGDKLPMTHPTIKPKMGKKGRILSANDLKDLLKRKGIEDKIDAAFDDRGLVLSLSSAVLFDVGAAQLRPNAEGVLEKMAELIKDTTYFIQVEGHTDNIPISTKRYSSNWDLSIDRAGRVLRYMVEKGGFAPERLSVVGFADTRPLYPNNTPEHRAANRRVELVLLD